MELTSSGDDKSFDSDDNHFEPLTAKEVQDDLQVANVKPIGKKDAIKIALELSRKLAIRLKCTAQPNLAKYTDLAETHRLIGEHYAIAMEWETAAMNMSATAKHYVALARRKVAATCFEDAAIFYRNANLHEESLEQLERAILLCVGEGELGIAARLETQLGYNLKHLLEPEEAREHFERASLYIREDGDPLMSTEAAKEMSYLSGELQEYERCRDELVEIGEIQLSNNLTQFNCPIWFLNACLAHFLLKEEESEDLESMAHEVKEFVHQLGRRDCMFPGSRECQLIKDILKAYIGLSMDDFADHVYNFDSIHKFDFWQLSLLKRIQQALKFEIKLDKGSDSSGSDSGSYSGGSDESSDDESSSDSGSGSGGGDSEYSGSSSGGSASSDD